MNATRASEELLSGVLHAANYFSERSPPGDSLKSQPSACEQQNEAPHPRSPLERRRKSAPDALMSEVPNELPVTHFLRRHSQDKGTALPVEEGFMNSIGKMQNKYMEQMDASTKLPKLPQSSKCSGDNSPSSDFESDEESSDEKNLPATRTLTEPNLPATLPAARTLTDLETYLKSNPAALGRRASHGGERSPRPGRPASSMETFLQNNPHLMGRRASHGGERNMPMLPQRPASVSRIKGAAGCGMYANFSMDSPKSPAGSIRKSREGSKETAPSPSSRRQSKETSKPPGAASEVTEALESFRAKKKMNEDCRRQAQQFKKAHKQEQQQREKQGVQGVLVECEVMGGPDPDPEVMGG